MRLDARLVAAGKVTSRSRAADLIKRGLVTLDGKRLKASDKVTTTDFDRLDISDHRWVSRAALKLVEALRQCPDFDPRGHACIDIGAVKTNTQKEPVTCSPSTMIYSILYHIIIGVS